MTEVSLYFGCTITVRYFPVCDCRHLYFPICFMTIRSSSPHGLQRACICTVYKQTYRQLQADVDSLCQFPFRENTLCRSRRFTFCIKQQEREREMCKEQRYWKNMHQRPCCFPPHSECSLSNHKCERHAHQQGLDWTVIGSAWLMTQHYGILRTREGKSLRTRSDVPLKYAPVSKRLIMALWNVKEHVS